MEQELQEHKPSTRQVILFTVILSFVVSMIGTVLTLGVFAPLSSGEAPSTFIFRRTEKAPEASKETQRVLRQDDLVVKTVEDVSPAVVSVVASKDVPVIERYYVDPFGSDPFFQQFFGDNPSIQIPQFRQKGTQKKEVSAGTGFIVSADGLIITNRHVVADSDAQYTVFLNDGSKKQARVLARDPLQDIAILKIEGSGFPMARLSDATTKAGQTVIAIGNALGEFRNTVSVGVVSGLHRSVTASGGGAAPETLQELIQTDAAINPGNSGGPLLNINGEVIGINTAMAQGAENIGFAIPISRAKRDLASVKTQGRIVYPFLGIRYVPVTKDLAEKEKLSRDYGAWVVGGENDPAVVVGSPADKAGVKERDIILELNGERIDIEHALGSLIQKYRPGDEIALKIFRNNQEITVKVKLEERK